MIATAVAAGSFAPRALAQEAQPVVPASAPAARAAVPPRLPRPRSPSMVHAGMVLTGLGIFGAVVGLLTIQRGAAAESPSTERVGAGILAGGSVLLAVGIPVWTFGAAPEPRE